MTTDSSPAPSSPPRSLSLFDCVCIIVGTIIGSGIFKIPTMVAANVPSPTWLFLMWILGGSIALIGALCFAELTTTYPDRGGDYGYLKRSFGQRVGFAFSWTAFWVIRPGNIGAMAVIFGEFAKAAFPGSLSVFQFACLALVGTSAANLFGVVAGKLTQNFLTVVKVVGILLVMVAAFWIGWGAEIPEPAVAKDAGEATTEWFWLSMVFVMFAFGGWNDIAFVASETREPKKNLFRALLLGTGAVLLIYLLFNAALMFGLGFDRMHQMMGQNAPAVLASEGMGAVGVTLVSVLVSLSCLGAMSAMIFTSPRIYWATAQDYPARRWLVGAGGKGRVSMLAQAVVTFGFIFAFGRKKDGFDVLVFSSAPYFWLFLALTVCGMMVCRIRYKGQFEGYRVPCYPVLPLVFVAACGFMVYRAWTFMLEKDLAIAAAIIGSWVLLGFVLSFLLKPTKKDA